MSAPDRTSTVAEICRYLINDCGWKVAGPHHLTHRDIQGGKVMTVYEALDAQLAREQGGGRP